MPQAATSEYLQSKRERVHKLIKSFLDQARSHFFERYQDKYLPNEYIDEVAQLQNNLPAVKAELGKLDFEALDALEKQYVDRMIVMGMRVDQEEVKCEKSGNGRYSKFINKYQSGEYKTQTIEMKSGDTVWDIAQRIGVDTELLLQMNDVKDSKKLQIGTEIHIPLDRRPLTNVEIGEAEKVFGNSIDYSKVEVAKDTKWSNAFGLDGVGPIRASTMVTGNTVNLNEKDSRSNTLRIIDNADLIHELTHVWQYQSSGNSRGYMMDSAKNQVLHGDDAYNYDKTGKTNFKDMTAEQQAMYIQEYYKQKYQSKSVSSLYQYKEKTILDIKKKAIKYGN
jgi:LysM repeat protein